MIMFWHVKAEDRPHQCAEYIGKAARVLIRLKRWDETDNSNDIMGGPQHRTVYKNL